MSSRVLALVEHPAGRGAEPEEARPAGKPRADRAAGSGPLPARVPRARPAGRPRAAEAAEAGGAASAEPAGASGPGGEARTEPASSPETGPGEPGEPASMVEDAVDRTASQLG
jgi:hypothetical protein